MALMGAWIWVFIRVGGVVMTAPLIGTRAVPARVRLVFAVTLTLTIAPLVAAPTNIDIATLRGGLVGINQVIIGASIGLTIRLVFAAAELAGQIAAQQMGLGFASLVDPQSGSQVPVVSQFYIILTTLLFFTFDAHLALIALINDSFTLLPVGMNGMQAAAIEMILNWSRTLFSGALSVVMPVIVALLVVNIAFGVMARSAPQLNIFAVGFPVMMVFGMLAVYLTLDQLETSFRLHLQDAFEVARGALSQ